MEAEAEEMMENELPSIEEAGAEAAEAAAEVEAEAEAEEQASLQLDLSCLDRLIVASSPYWDVELMMGLAVGALLLLGACMLAVKAVATVPSLHATSERMRLAVQHSVGLELPSATSLAAKVHCSRLARVMRHALHHAVGSVHSEWFGTVGGGIRLTARRSALARTPRSSTSTSLVVSSLHGELVRRP